MKKIEFDNSHIYPGSIAKLSFKVSSNSAFLEVDVEFIDGSRTVADLQVLPKKEMILIVAPYTTAAGTKIGKKGWRLSLVEEMIWRVTEKQLDIK
ncbi:hypothetical protein [Sphingobacterium sp. HMA12]|uniref:hypothetical protein n=1 Tax=Sphingobacterium sp. HMA12 TaxID=2050894 RepID=UPI000CEA4B91|nr:hypothetical protein [Sphingobacterium sp. HMA12]